MSDDVTLDLLISYAPLLILISALSSLIPSAICRWLMSRIFHEEVSFWLLLGVSTLTVLLTLFSMIWLGFGVAMTAQTMPPGPAALLAVAAYAFQVAMLTMFVTDSDFQVIAMWKWIVVLIAQAVVYFLISLTIGLAIGLALATV